MSSSRIDRNKVQRVETPYGNGYYYNGRLYSDSEFESLENENNNNNFRKGGPAKPGDAGYVNSNNPVEARNQMNKEKQGSSQQNPIVSENPGDPTKKSLPAGYSQSQIDSLYSTGNKGGMNQAAVLAFEREYGTGFRPGQPASVPADTSQAKSPALANMMDSNFSSNVPNDMSEGVFYGNYDDTIVRNGSMAKGVQINPVPGDYQIKYENPIYENALKGNWTGQNVDTQVMPDKNQQQPQQPQNTSTQPSTQPAADNKPAKTDGYDYTNEASTFSAAFSAARQAGLKTFKYKGNVHTTEITKPAGTKTATGNKTPSKEDTNYGQYQSGTAPAQKYAEMKNGVEPAQENQQTLRSSASGVNRKIQGNTSSSSQQYKRWSNASGGYEVVDNSGRLIRMASPEDSQKLKDYKSQAIQNPK